MSRSTAAGPGKRRSTRVWSRRHRPEPQKSRAALKGLGKAEGGPGPPSAFLFSFSVRDPGLVRLEVAVALPLRNVLAEVVPLCLLRAREALEDVIAEGFPDERIGLHLGHRLAQCRGQGRDVAPLQVLVCEVVEVLLDRLGQ